MRETLAVAVTDDATVPIALLADTDDDGVTEVELGYVEPVDADGDGDCGGAGEAEPQTASPPPTVDSAAACASVAA